MQVDVYNQKGEKTGKIELSDAVFGVPFNEAVVHQALLMQLANRRQGTADTKTRAEVLKVPGSSLPRSILVGHDAGVPSRHC